MGIGGYIYGDVVIAVPKLPLVMIDDNGMNEIL